MNTLLHTDHSEIQYYNITIPNKVAGGKTEMVYNKNNTEPIIKDIQSYKVAIARLTIPVGNLPITIFHSPNKDGFIDQNVTLYFYDGVYNYSTKQLFMKANQTQFNTSQDEYYWLYTYDELVEMYNIALKEAFDELSSLCTLPANSFAPFMNFNSKSQLFNIHFSLAYALPEPIKLFLNGPSMGLFSGSLWYIEYKNPSPFIGYFNLIVVKDYIINRVIVDGNIYIKMEQTVITVDKINTLRSIQILCNLPISQEVVDYDYFSSQVTKKETVLRDIQVRFPKFNSIPKITIDYDANNYFYINLNGNQDIRNIQLNIYWVDRFGTRRKMYLIGKEAAQIKLIFMKTKYLEYHSITEIN